MPNTNSQLSVEAPLQPEAIEENLRRQVRLHYLDGLRAVAALVVIFTHCYFCIWTGQPDRVGRLLYRVLYGHEGVVLFLVLSGYCLMLPCKDTLTLRRGWLDFYKHRSLRILPPYYVAIGVSLLLIYTIIPPPTRTLWNASATVTPIGIVSHALMFSDVLGNQQINYALWSVALEWRIYFLFPLLLWAWRRWGLAWPSVGVVALYLLLSIPVAATSSECFPYFVGLFIVGALATQIRRPIKHLQLYAVAWIVAELAFLSTVNLRLSLHHSAIENYMRDSILDLLLGVAFAALLASLAASKEEGLRKALSWRPLTAIGTISYSVYLLHAPLLEVATRYFIDPLQGHLSSRAPWQQHLISFVLLLILATALTLMCSYLFYLFVERPFVRGGRKILSASPVTGQQ